MTETLRFRVNGQPVRSETDPDRPLLDLLREDLGLTGTKYGCGEGECGACTVLIDGVATRSCITSSAEVAGAAIETIEGLEVEGQLHLVQQAFIEHGAMQCGYCIPGFIMSAAALMRHSPNADLQQWRSVLSQHVCRCCNYAAIDAAINQLCNGGQQ